MVCHRESGPGGWHDEGSTEQGRMMEENNKGFCAIHHERTQNIIEIKEEIRDSRKDFKEIKTEICNLELKIDKELDNKVSWSTFKWVIAGLSCVMMFVLGTQ